MEHTRHRDFACCKWDERRGVKREEETGLWERAPRKYRVELEHASGFRIQDSGFRIPACPTNDNDN